MNALGDDPIHDRFRWTRTSSTQVPNTPIFFMDLRYWSREQMNEGGTYFLFARDWNGLRKSGMVLSDMLFHTAFRVVLIYLLLFLVSAAIWSTTRAFPYLNVLVRAASGLTLCFVVAKLLARCATSSNRRRKGSMLNPLLQIKDFQTSHCTSWWEFPTFLVFVLFPPKSHQNLLRFFEDSSKYKVTDTDLCFLIFADPEGANIWNFQFIFNLYVFSHIFCFLVYWICFSVYLTWIVFFLLLSWKVILTPRGHQNRMVPLFFPLWNGLLVGGESTAANFAFQPPRPNTNLTPTSPACPQADPGYPGDRPAALCLVLGRRRVDCRCQAPPEGIGLWVWGSLNSRTCISSKKNAQTLRSVFQGPNIDELLDWVSQPFHLTQVRRT